MNENSKILEERVSLTTPRAKLRHNSERNPTLALNRKLIPSYSKTPKNSPLYTNKENILVFNPNGPLIIKS